MQLKKRSFMVGQFLIKIEIYVNIKFQNLVKVSDSDYDVKKLANERPVYTVIDQW